MDRQFKQWKKHCFSKVDFSKKGSIDEEIYPVVSLLNGSSDYFTTSSCSGRIILIDGLSECSKVQKQNCSWLFVTHQKCEEANVHTVAINAGFRNSGVSIGKKGKIIMAVRSTHCLEVPLTFNGEILVNENYIHFLVQTANQKMAENSERIERFFDGLKTALQTDGSQFTSTGKDKMTKTAKKWHQTKNQDLVHDESQIVQNSDLEDYLETSLIFS